MKTTNKTQQKRSKYLSIDAGSCAVADNELQSLIKPSVTRIETVENVVVRDVDVLIGSIVVQTDREKCTLDNFEIGDVFRTQLVQPRECFGTIVTVSGG